MKTALVVVALVAAACSSSTSGGGGGGAPFEVEGTPVATTHVELPQSYQFSPAVITVKAGSTVTWTNHDNFPHNVTLLDGSGVSKDVAIGATVSIEFDHAGTVYYHCAIHPQQMHGKVIVTG